MTKKQTRTRLPKTFLPAIVLTFSLACTAPVLAQGAQGGASPGTAGAGNAAAASDGYGGLGGPATTGTGPGSRNPGGSNGAVETAPPPPAANPSQVPSTAGTTNQSTTPTSGTVGMSTGRIPGHTGRVSNVQDKSDPVVEDTEKEVSKRIKNICRGC
jgi:hypothetical protein